MPNPTIKQFTRDKSGAIYILRSDGTIWYGTHFQSCGSECQLLQLDIQYCEIEAPSTQPVNDRFIDGEDIPF